MFKDKIRGAIIPHAGKFYAGNARESVFKFISPSTKYIIYLAALHYPKKIYDKTSSQRR